MAERIRNLGANARVIRSSKGSTVFVAPRRFNKNRVPKPKSIDGGKLWGNPKLRSGYLGNMQRTIRILDDHPVIDETGKFLTLSDSLPKNTFFGGRKRYDKDGTYDFWDLRQIPAGATVIVPPKVVLRQDANGQFYHYVEEKGLFQNRSSGLEANSKTGMASATNPSNLWRLNPQNWLDGEENLFLKNFSEPFIAMRPGTRNSDNAEIRNKLNVWLMKIDEEIEDTKQGALSKSYPVMEWRNGLMKTAKDIEEAIENEYFSIPAQEIDETLQKVFDELYQDIFKTKTNSPAMDDYGNPFRGNVFDIEKVRNASLENMNEIKDFKINDSKEIKKWRNNPNRSRIPTSRVQNMTDEDMINEGITLELTDEGEMIATMDDMGFLRRFWRDRKYNRMAESWKLTQDEYLDKMLTGFIRPDTYRSKAEQLDYLVGDPDPLTEIPDWLGKITNGSKKAYIPENQVHARPYGGQFFDTWEEAEEYALYYANSQRNDYSSHKLPGKGSYPKLLKSIDGIEYRQTNERLGYASNQRDADGMAIMLTDAEMKLKGLPIFDRSIVAFDGDRPIGVISDEWGVPGVWVIRDYQNRNIGLNLADTYAEEGEKIGFRYSLSGKGALGQATPAGRRLAGRYHKLLVERALKSGKNVPEDVLQDYPDLLLTYEMEGKEGFL